MQTKMLLYANAFCCVADIYKEMSRGSSRAQFALDEVSHSDRFHCILFL